MHYDDKQSQLEQDIKNLKAANDRLQQELEADAMNAEIEWTMCREMAVTDGTFNLGDLQ